MGVTIDLLPPGTIEGDSTDELVQEVCESIDTSKHSTGVASIYILKRSAGTPNNTKLVVEGSDDGQSFVTVVQMDAVGRAEMQMNRSEPPGSAARLYKIMRWKIVPGAANWVLCSRATVTLK